MEKKSNKVLLFLVLLLISSVTTFRCCSAAAAAAAAAKQGQNNKKLTSPLLAASDNRIGSSAVFLIRGNVYPDGYYYVDLKIGNPPKPYYLDIDTGSDLTWLNCDAPCVRCPKVPHPLYRPKKNYVVFCQDPVCATIQPESQKCEKPNDQCDYEVEYADQASSLGVLVKDVFPIRFTNGTILGPQLAFGCGYDQQDSNDSPSPTDGVLGLGNGKASIVSQLQSLGLIRNVIGHCFSSRGGGFLFFGDDLVPSSGVTWTPMSRQPLQENYYSPGPADLVFEKPYTGAKGLLVVFDSGSSYTYFNSQAYQALISFINKDLNGKPLKRVADETLPVCWKGSKPFKSMRDVKKYFKPLLLSLTDGKKAPLEISPESYLILLSHGNVCLGILNGTEIGLQNLNIIGDIFFQDKVVIYDNEKQQIGWASADCNRLPNIDREDEGGFSQPFAITNMGVLPEEHWPASQEDDHEGWF